MLSHADQSHSANSSISRSALSHPPPFKTSSTPIGAHPLDSSLSSTPLPKSQDIGSRSKAVHEQRVSKYGSHHISSEESCLIKRIKEIKRQYDNWRKTGPEADKRRLEIAQKGGIAFDQRRVCQPWTPRSPDHLMPDSPVWITPDYLPPTLTVPFPSTGTPLSDNERKALTAYSRLRSQKVDICQWFADRQRANTKPSHTMYMS